MSGLTAKEVRVADLTRWLDAVLRYPYPELNLWREARNRAARDLYDALRDVGVHWVEPSEPPSGPETASPAREATPAWREAYKAVESQGRPFLAAGDTAAVHELPADADAEWCPRCGVAFVDIRRGDALTEDPDLATCVADLAHPDPERRLTFEQSTRLIRERHSETIRRLGEEQA